MDEKPQIIVTGENHYYTTVTPVLFKTTSMAFSARGLIFKGLADLFLVATGNSARDSGRANP